MKNLYILLALKAVFALAHPPTLTTVPPKLTNLHRRAISPEVLLENGRQAQKLNAKYLTMTSETTCKTGEHACVNGGFAQCVGEKFVGTGCAPPLKCFELPLLLKSGSTPGCDSEADAEARIANTGATGGIRGEATSANGTTPVTSNSSAEADQPAGGNVENFPTNSTKNDSSSSTDSASTAPSNTTSLNATDTAEDGAGGLDDQASASDDAQGLADNQTDTATKGVETTTSDASNATESTANATVGMPAKVTTGSANSTLHDSAGGQEC